MSILMKRNNGVKEFAVSSGLRRYFVSSVLVLLLLTFVGCATAPTPIIIRHDKTSSRSDAGVAAPSDQNRVETIAAKATQEIMKSLQTEIKKQVREEFAEEIRATEKEQIDTITASVIEEIRKDFSKQVKSQVREEMTKEVEKLKLAAAPEWTRRFKFSGDVRLRYEKDYFDDNNFNEFTKISEGTDKQELLNTTNDKNRVNYRIRLGLKAKVNEQLETIIRLSTGKTSNPVSTNDLLGDYMNKDSILFDRAYLSWKPEEFYTLMFTINGGRMANPWFSSNLVWDNDLNFEGLAVNMKKLMTNLWTPFITAGAFSLQKDDFSGESKWLFAGQAGLEKKNRKGISAKLGAAYYYFYNISGVFNNNSLQEGLTDWSAPLYQQKGNTLFFIDPDNSYRVGLVSEFRELNITGSLDIGFWDPVHIVFITDYVKNFGFDQSRAKDLLGDMVPDNPDNPDSIGFQAPPENTEGYLIGMSIGYPKIERLGQWKTSFSYKYLGADAVVDAFTDSDFHLGGTNAEGWVLGTELGLMKNTWLRLRWLTADNISGAPLAIDVLQVDLNARF